MTVGFTSGVPRGLAGRMLVGSAALLLVVGATFAVLIVSLRQLQDSSTNATRSQQALVAANHLERLVVDIETGERGFVLTGDEVFLQPWTEGQATLPGASRALVRAVNGDDEPALVEKIVTGARSYVQDHSVPVVELAKRHDPSAASVAGTLDGKRRVDALRSDFDRLLAVERVEAAARERTTDAATARAFIAAAAGLGGSTLIIVFFAIYLHRVIVSPVLRASSMAGRLASGDLSVRMNETGVGEIGALERSFNAMAAALEESRDALAASRARVVAAGDESRRRIERDLHDGTQQRLVSLGLELRAVETAVPADLGDLKTQIAQVGEGLNDAVDELQEISRGIHPALLSKGGLGPALKALARRAVIPVDLDLDVERRLPEAVEVAVYYVVSEDLTNAAKHGRASSVAVQVGVDDTALQLSIRDDGVGGADPERGSGLLGLNDRVEVLGGKFTLSSVPGRGTSIAASIPIGDQL